MKNNQRILVAMSGGVDSSVAAAVLLDQGYEVVGVTMKLWGGASDTGCCSVSDVIDARRVADQLGIQHHVFNFGDEFDTHVVNPYVDAHKIGETPNPCIECNRHVKFDKLFRRATALGFDLIATGHHAQIVSQSEGLRLSRSVDLNKDQSYVLHMLNEAQLARLKLPIGNLTKEKVREIAASLSLQTAEKADSQDVCFISRTKGGRQRFLEQHMVMTPGQVIDTQGKRIANVPAVQMVTIGQRKGLGVSGVWEPQYAVDVNVESATVTTGPKTDLYCDQTLITDIQWIGEPIADSLEIQTSAHGRTAQAKVIDKIYWEKPHRKIAPGQSAVFYSEDKVVGSGIVSRS